jgi:putative ABC transport system substrate-binding protein
VAPGVNAAVAARNVTNTIPIVSWALADAIELGLVASYARPGGNVTGIMPYVEGLPAKQMQFARQLVPSARKVGILGNSNDPKAPPQQHEMELAAATLNIGVVVPKLQSPDELQDAMRLLAAEKVDVAMSCRPG